jgi:hypothetical protein
MALGGYYNHSFGRCKQFVFLRQIKSGGARPISFLFDPSTFSAILAPFRAIVPSPIFARKKTALRRGLRFLQCWTFMRIHRCVAILRLGWGSRHTPAQRCVIAGLSDCRATLANQSLEAFAYVSVHAGELTSYAERQGVGRVSASRHLRRQQLDRDYALLP